MSSFHPIICALDIVGQVTNIYSRISNLSAAMHVRQFSRELQCALQFGLIPDETHATVVFIPIQHEACCRITLSETKNVVQGNALIKVLIFAYN